MSDIIQLIIGGAVAVFAMLLIMLKGTQKKLEEQKVENTDLKKETKVAEKKAEVVEKKAEVIEEYHEKVDEAKHEGHVKAEEVLKDNPEALRIYNEVVKKWNIGK